LERSLGYAEEAIQCVLVLMSQGKTPAVACCEARISQPMLAGSSANREARSATQGSSEDALTGADRRSCLTVRPLRLSPDYLAADGSWLAGRL
jgi:hypothetical protein